MLAESLSLPLSSKVPSRGGKHLRALEYVWLILRHRGSMYLVANDLLRRYGPAIWMTTGSKVAWVDARLETVEEVLNSKASCFRKNESSREFRALFGDGLFTAEGDKWEHDRGLINRLFFRQAMRQMTQMTKEQLPIELSPWIHKVQAAAESDNPGLKVKLCDLIRPLMVGLSASSLWGVTDHAARELMSAVTERFFQATSYSPLNPLSKRLGEQSFLRLRTRLDHFMSTLIAERRTAGLNGGHFLDSMLKIQAEERRKAEADPTLRALTDRDVRDHVLSMLVASYDTLSLSLSWALYLLGSRPEMQDRIVQEDQDEEGAAPFATWVYQETLRLYAPVWMLGREAKQDVDLQHMRLKAGDVVMIPLDWIHKDPDYWQDPLDFRPERFAGNASEAHGAHYVPFGLGPRACIGRGLALWQGRAILQQILRYFVVSSPKPAMAKPAYHLIMSSPDHLSVQLSPRL